MTGFMIAPSIYGDIVNVLVKQGIASSFQLIPQVCGYRISSHSQRLRKGEF